jgi:hypothetical protein
MTEIKLVALVTGAIILSTELPQQHLQQLQMLVSSLLTSKLG